MIKFEKLNIRDKFWYKDYNITSLFIKINDTQAINVLDYDNKISDFYSDDICYFDLKDLIKSIEDKYKSKLQEIAKNVNDSMDDYINIPFDFNADDLKRIVNSIIEN